MTKTIFKSKTAAVSLITTVAGVLAQFYPQVGEFVAERSAEILVALGMVSLILRLITKNKVTLFPS